MQNELCGAFAEGLARMIRDITGAFLIALNQNVTSSSKEEKSLASGALSDSVDFDAANLDIRPGLIRASDAFRDSQIRFTKLNKDLESVENRLDSLYKISVRMSEIAEKSSEINLTDQEREFLQSELSSLIRKYKSIRSSSEDEIEDLSLSSFEEAIQAAGVDKNQANSITSRLRSLGGSDGELGYERLSSSSSQLVDPLGLSVGSRSEAIEASEVFIQLKNEIKRDLESVKKTREIASGVASYADVAKIAFLESGSVLVLNDKPNQIAEELVMRIKSLAGSSNLSEYSSIDSRLAKELLTE